MAPSQTRVWMAPLMLIFLVAMIYLLSLMPPQPPYTAHGVMEQEEPKEFALKHLDWNENKKSYHVKWRDVGFRKGVVEDDADTFCVNGGVPHTNGTCICPRFFQGDRCQIPLCMHGGKYNETNDQCECVDPWVGEHCLYKCIINNQTTGNCECPQGKPCIIHKCVNGQLIDGRCACYDGFTGPGCGICDPNVNGAYCEERYTISGIRRRGAVNSRLTLSGLSFCAITIGLLCVAASRRRSGPMPNSDETWYRVFHPTHNRSFGSRCRHDYICGGLWMPRDRALVVAPGRVSISNGRSSSNRRSPRVVTPPPSYNTVDDQNAEEVSPPTYDEATRVFLEVDNEHNEPEVKEESSTVATVANEEEPTTTTNQTTI